MAKVVIIEDEPLAAEKLSMLLNKLDPSFEIIGKAESLSESTMLLNQVQPDLIFLDIHLSDGISLKLFDYTEINCPVIFVTAYDQYAIEAFHHFSIDYLLKPIQEEDLARSLKKYRKLFQGNQFQNIDGLRASLSEKKRERILVTFGGKSQSVPVEQVAFFYALDKSVYLKTFENRRLPVDRTLDQLEPTLDQKLFFRISRKMIIHVNAIKELQPYSSRRLFILTDPVCEIDPIVPAEKIKELKKWLDL